MMMMMTTTMFAVDVGCSRYSQCDDRRYYYYYYYYYLHR